MIGPRGKTVENSKSALIRYGVRHEAFGAEEMRRRHPGVKYPSDYEFVLDKTGGILMADKVLKAFQVEIFLAILLVEHYLVLFILPIVEQKF